MPEIVMDFGGHTNIAIHILMIFFGYFVAMCVNYIKFGQELSYIKGQLNTILEGRMIIDNLAQKSAAIDATLARILHDLDLIVRRVEILEETKKGDL